MLTRLMVVIILQYLQISIHYIVHLKLSQLYVLTTPQFLKRSKRMVTSLFFQLNPNSSQYIFNIIIYANKNRKGFWNKGGKGKCSLDYNKQKQTQFKEILDVLHILRSDLSKLIARGIYIEDSLPFSNSLSSRIISFSTRNQHPAKPALGAIKNLLPNGLLTLSIAL